MKQNTASNKNVVIGNFMQKTWTNFKKDSQEVRRFEENMWNEHNFGA